MSTLVDQQKKEKGLFFLNRSVKCTCLLGSYFGTWELKKWNTDRDFEKLVGKIFCFISPFSSIFNIFICVHYCFKNVPIALSHLHPFHPTQVITSFRRNCAKCLFRVELRNDCWTIGYCFLFMCLTFKHNTR